MFKVPEEFDFQILFVILCLLIPCGDISALFAFILHVSFKQPKYTRITLQWYYSRMPMLGMLRALAGH